jgi:hypothetical protein
MNSSENEFKDQVVVVTGVASGIGKSVVTSLLHTEAYIVAVDASYCIQSRQLNNKSHNERGAFFEKNNSSYYFPHTLGSRMVHAL